MNLLLNERYLFAGFMLDLVAGRFFADGEEVQLRPKSFALLSYMVRNAGRVVSKDELMTALWPEVTVTEDSLTQCVRDVRRALADDGAAMLRTVPRRGYMLDVEVKSPREFPPPPIADHDAHGALIVDRAVTDGSANLEPQASPRANGQVGLMDASHDSRAMARPMLNLGRSRWIVLAGGSAALVLAAFAAWWTMPTTAPVLRDAPPSLAITPFVNLTGDPERVDIANVAPYFTGLILSSSPVLKSAANWTDVNIGQPGGVPGIAGELGVDLLLEGGIRRVAAGFSFSGSLYDGPSGNVLSTIKADAPDGDLARLPYLIAQAVLDEVSSLSGNTTGVILDAAWGETSDEPDEYSYFLRSQSMLQASTIFAEEDVLQMIDDGLTRYPNSVRLRLLKAEILMNRSNFGKTKDSWENAQAAWAILSGIPELSTLPPLERWQLHYVRAGLTRLATGDFETGMRDAEEARRLIPYSGDNSVNSLLISVAADAGHGARAVEWARTAMRSDPRPGDDKRDMLAYALLIDGRPEEALTEWAQTRDFCMACKVVALVRTGRLDEASRMVKTMREQTPHITIGFLRTWPTGRYPSLPEPFLSAFLGDLRKAGLPETGPPPP